MRTIKQTAILMLISAFSTLSLFAQETNEARNRFGDNSREPRPVSVSKPQNHFDDKQRHDHINRAVYDYVANEEQVQMIVRLLKNTSFDDKKLEVAKVCLALRPVYAEGLVRIARTFSFDDNRLKFLKYAYEFCPDPENVHYFRNAFSFTSNYNEFMRYVEKHRRPNHNDRRGGTVKSYHK